MNGRIAFAGCLLLLVTPAAVLAQPDPHAGVGPADGGAHAEQRSIPPGPADDPSHETWYITGAVTGAAWEVPVPGVGCTWFSCARTGNRTEMPAEAWWALNGSVRSIILESRYEARTPGAALRLTATLQPAADPGDERSFSSAPGEYQRLRWDNGDRGLPNGSLQGDWRFDIEEATATGV